MNLRELLQRRAQLVAQGRALLDVPAGENGDLSQEQRTQYDAIWVDINKLNEQITRLEQQEAMERSLQAATTGAGAGRPEPGDGARTLPEFVSRGMRHIRENSPELFEEPLWRQLFPYATDDYRGLFRRALRTVGAQRDMQLGPAMRALSAAEDIYGGYLVTPVQFVDRLIQAVDNLVYIRQWASVFSVPNADSLGAVSLDNDPADPTWTSELAIGTEDSTMSLGKRELHPHPLAKYIKISRTLLRKVPDVEALVRSRFAYKFGVVMENNYLNGTGAGQPLGVFTASDNGIPTTRDVSTGNTATEMRFDGLIEAKFSLKTQYWPQARWLFHRDGVKQIARLKDGEGQYIWRESVRVGEPDRILGFPCFMSEYTPSTFTTGQYVGIVGDFSFYWIADSLQMELLRLVELYAASNQVGIIARAESDGMPVLGEAFARVKLG